MSENIRVGMQCLRSLHIDDAPGEHRGLPFRPDAKHEGTHSARADMPARS